MNQKQKRTTIMVVNGFGGYDRPFRDLGFEVSNYERTLFQDPESIALVVFTGGEDVSPSLYNRSKHPSTYNNPRRDEVEVRAFKQAFEERIPMAGICRGSQFLCAMAGGELIQDVRGHGGSHEVVYKLRDGQEGRAVVTSTHHQMQNPFGLPAEDYELVAWCEEPRSPHYAIDDKLTYTQLNAPAELLLEPDVVYYKRINALAAQYHPEYMPEESTGYQLYQELIRQYLLPLMEDYIDDGEQERKRAA